jgi:hypothetical protein
MSDNPLIVALLKEYKDEASLTRTEVGRIIGKTRGQVAGICHRNGIAPWPLVPKEVTQNRSCQFPIGKPATEEFHLCGKQKAPGLSLLCSEHERQKWVPKCEVIPLEKK